MNKPVIITIAVGILMLALGSWLYLFLFGAPQSPDEIFTDLGITPPVDTSIIPMSDNSESLPQIDINTGLLQQLTFRPIAGYGTPTNGSVVYMEQGTGHLYEINTVTGQETRLTNTTIPVATRAIFNIDASAVVVISGLPGERVVFLAERAGESLNRTSLPPTADNIHFNGTSTLTYTVSDQTSTRGYEYNSATDSQRELFIAPFRSLHIHTTGNEWYVSNRPATALEGALYAIDETVLTPVNNPAFGFIALMSDRLFAQTILRNNQLESSIASLISDEVIRIAPVMIPEKCDWSETELICASPFTVDDERYIERWYQGLVRSDDLLWAIDPTSGGARMLVNPEREVGRPLDITDVSVRSVEEVFFVNRLDNTLWRYADNPDS
jgi:hypothetical protein